MSDVIASDKGATIRAIVDGKVITDAKLQGAIASQSALLAHRFRAGEITQDPYDQEEKALERNRLNGLIERALILGEFKRLNEPISDRRMDEDIARIIEAQFDGDREQFLNSIKTSSAVESEDAFRKLRRIPWSNKSQPSLTRSKSFR